jgi:hypothetical protein
MDFESVAPNDEGDARLVPVSGDDTTFVAIDEPEKPGLRVPEFGRGGGGAIALCQLDQPVECAEDRFGFGGVLTFARPVQEIDIEGSRCLRIVSAGFPFYGFAYVMIAAFNGAGDTRTPTWINIGCLWLWEIPLAWALAHPAGFGPTGVFIACAVAFTTMAVVSTALFHRGTWKTRRV